jgi:hypothetical protein
MKIKYSIIIEVRADAVEHFLPSPGMDWGYIFRVIAAMENKGLAEVIVTSVGMRMVGDAFPKEEGGIK